MSKAYYTALNVIQYTKTGSTAKQCAEELGLSEAYVRVLAGAHGVRFIGEVRKPNKNRSAASDAILAKYQDGVSQADLAREFGVSRQRIQQIIARGGAIGEWQARKLERASIAEKIKTGNMTWEAIDREFGTHRDNIRRICHEFGIALPQSQREVDRDAKVKDIIERFNRGEGSVRRLSCGDLLIGRRVNHVMIRDGMRPARYRKQERPEPIPQADVIVMATDRETAIANYGRVPASRIAKAIGQTRNSVIGHWFRARRDGQIGELA